MRDEVVKYVQYWSDRAEVPVSRLTGWLGLGRAKYYDWQARRGRPNAHNAPVPRWFWLLPEEREAIVAFRHEYPLEGYRQLTYMMIDAEVAFASPSTVYRVLKEQGLLGRPADPASAKGQGFDQPTEPHEHWHMDISYLNICGTFFYLCGVLDGFSRYVVHWELRERMTRQDVAIILQRGAEKFPDARPRIITDNGPQFIARDFKAFIHLCGMTHVNTSPYYPQSNGKYERWNRSVKAECIRPQTPLSVDDARRVVDRFVAHYNEVRLHSAIGYVTPKDKLQGRAEQVLARRREKLQAARRRRKETREQGRSESNLTPVQTCCRIPLAGETEASSAEEQLARDNRSGKRRDIAAEAAPTGRSRAHTASLTDPPDASENLGSQTASYILKPEPDLSISR